MSRREDVLALAVALTPTWFIWHTEVALAAGGIGCHELGPLTNGVLTFAGCDIYHILMYATLAVCYYTAIAIQRRSDS